MAATRRQFRYVRWADLRILEALRETPEAHAEALPLLAHLLAAEHIWLNRLQRGLLPHEERDPSYAPWPTLSMAECEALAAANHTSYDALFEQLDEDHLSTVISYRTSQGQAYSNLVCDILTHVITHGPYHRGQIAKVIGRCGGMSVNTDFITFAREVETL
jgi:uncharacterized damage-inducible protein DinB